jgi:hypothetical protein
LEDNEMARVQTPQVVDPLEPVIENSPEAEARRIGALAAQVAAKVAPVVQAVAAPLTAAAKAVADQMIGRAAEIEKIEKPKFYVVQKTTTVALGQGGMRAPLPMGKMISSQHYDIPALKRQGVLLQEIEAPL